MRDGAANESTEVRVLSVAELTRRLKESVESQFWGVWLAGEVSDVTRPQSGHIYLTVKDEAAQIRAVIWRSTVQRLKCDVTDGQQVICQGDIEVYAPRGSYQLVIRRIELRGVGALELKLRQLQKRLADEGLFAPERKRPLPAVPRRVALVTSPTGAAVRDFLEVVRRRWNAVDVLILPVRVQGPGSADEIAAALRAANRLVPAPSVIVVARGGGSLEDLWSFNEEVVVRAIAASAVPVVSAVGHEIDVTLSDLAADVRALTPTEAAERIVPAAEAMLAALRNYRSRLDQALRSRALTARARLESLANHREMRRPLDRIHDHARRLDESGQRLRRACGTRADAVGQQVRSLAARLESLSPLAVLARGYTVTQHAGDGTLITDAGQLAAGDQITTRFARGEATSRVERFSSDET